MSKLIYHQTTSPFYKDKSTNNAYLSKESGLTLIRFDCFKSLDWMDAVMTTRLGGVSCDHLSSLNLGNDRGDAPENVIKNHEILAKSLGLPIENLVKTHQVHQTNLAFVEKNHLPAGPDIRHFQNTDGLLTTLSNVALCIGAADCVPVFLVAKDTKEIAAVHSGWKGTVGRIGAKAVKELINHGSKPQNILALIGPSICQDNYEVTRDVIDCFTQEGFSKLQMQDITYQTDNIHYQLDLWAACYHYLKDAGLSPDNIHFSSICTFENHELLYSHRFTKGLRGNQNGVIWKK